MKRIVGLMFVTLIQAFILCACNIVTVVPIGEEAKWTGVEEFSADSEAEDQWTLVVNSIKKDAKNLSDVNITSNTAVSGEGIIKEFNTDTPKNYLIVNVSNEDYKIQVGKVYSGTAIRDAQKNMKFEDFNNQTEWSQFAKSLNSLMHTTVVEPLNLSKDVEGKNISFIGVATKDASEITITPVELKIQ